jgi:hypothetical protein
MIKISTPDAKYARWKRISTELALTEVCRQVYAETKVLPFKLNIFTGLFCITMKFLKSLSAEQRHAIRNLKLIIDDMNVKFLRSASAFLDGDEDGSTVHTAVSILEVIIRRVSQNMSVRKLTIWDRTTDTSLLDLPRVSVADATIPEIVLERN